MILLIENPPSLLFLALRAAWPWLACAASAVLTAGCCAYSAPAYVGPPSDHYDGAFFNTHPRVEHRGTVDLIRWQVHRKRGAWRERISSAPGPPPPHRVTGDALRVTFVNHSTLLVQTAGLNILTDPVWSDRIGPSSLVGIARKRPPGIRFENLPTIDIVVVSHNHYDHLDLRTLVRLSRRDRPLIITGLGNCALLEREEISRCHEVDWWNVVEIQPGVRVHAVPAQHFSNRGLCDRNLTLWLGFVIEAPGGPVYFAGDTGWGNHFAAIRQRFGPIRLAMLPIGAFLPRWFMRAVHIDPHEAVRAHRVLEARTSIGMHWGTFAQADDGELEPLEELARALAAAPPTAPFWVLDFGEGRDFD
jgi:L-ascorbate metabolism protein UlaG (beta-lactamase superfamily)